MSSSIGIDENFQTHLLINPVYKNIVQGINLKVLGRGIQLEHTRYDTVCDEIYRLVINDKLCEINKHEIEIEDAHKSFKIAHLLLYFCNNSIRNINGFALLTTRPQSIYVNLICAKNGFGKLLIDAISCICVNISKPTIELDSVESAVEFYKSVGFTLINGAGWQMIKRLVDDKGKYCDYLTSRRLRRWGGGQTHIQNTTAQNKKTTKDCA